MNDALREAMRGPLARLLGRDVTRTEEISGTVLEAVGNLATRAVRLDGRLDAIERRIAALEDPLARWHEAGGGPTIKVMVRPPENIGTAVTRTLQQARMALDQVMSTDGYGNAVRETLRLEAMREGSLVVISGWPRIYQSYALSLGWGIEP